MSLSDSLAKGLERLVAKPTLDEVLGRLARQARRQLGVSGVDLVHEARAEAGLDG